MLNASDAEVGHRLKQKVLEYRQGVLGLPGTKEPPAPVNAARDVRPPVAPRADLAQQAATARRRLVQEGHLLASSELRERLQVSKQSVSVANRANRLFTVDVDGQTYYPAFFADDHIDRSVLERISRQLGTLPGWTKWDFFVSRWGSLGDLSPLEALAKGKVDEVEKVARGFHEEMTH